MFDIKSQLIKFSLIALLSSVAIGLIYYKGYSKGKEVITNEYELSKAKAIEQALKDQEKRMKEEYKAAIEIEHRLKKLDDLFKKNMSVFEDLKKSSDALKNPACTLKKDEMDTINNLLKGLK